MASIGMRKPLVAKLTLDTGKYSAPAALGKAISVEITPNFAEGSLYADDVKIEADREFTDASVSLGVSTVPVSFQNTLFGHTVGGTGSSEVTYNADDSIGYVGLGFIGVEKIDGVKKYVATFLCKCKFQDSADSYTTKGDSITYNTPTLEGTALALDSGVWRKSNVCDTEAAALTWINTQFGVSG